MGNCLTHSKKLNAEIAPYDFIKSTTAVKLYGSPNAACTAYIRFALLYKTMSLHFIPTTDTQPTLQIGSVTISGTREMLLRFIDSKLPQPPLVMKEREGFGETTPWIVRAVVLQHRSMRWHLERMVRWGGDLATRGGRKAVDPAMGTPRMEIRKFSKSYSQLLEFMLEHAQMEERVVFPILEMADRGLCRAANEEHARDLPIINGIKEDIKSIGVLDTGSLHYQDALCNLSTRLKSLLEHCKEHFEEEERDVLPLMEAVELTKKQQLRVLEQCFDYAKMKVTHSMRFPAPLMSIGFSQDCMARAIGTSNGIIFGGKRKMKEKEEKTELGDFLGLGSVEEPQRRILKPTYFRYFHRSQGEKPNEGDYLIMRSKKVKLAEHDKLLKKFRHKEALVSALTGKNPENVVAVMEELVARRKLLKCVSNLDKEELGLLLGFLHKYSTMPRHSGLLMGLTRKVIEMRADDIRGSDALKDHIRNLKRSVEEEIRIQQSLQEIQGIISPLLRIAGRR